MWLAVTSGRDHFPPFKRHRDSFFPFRVSLSTNYDARLRIISLFSRELSRLLPDMVRRGHSKREESKDERATWVARSLFFSRSKFHDLDLDNKNNNNKNRTARPTTLPAHRVTAAAEEWE